MRYAHKIFCPFALRKKRFVRNILRIKILSLLKAFLIAVKNNLNFFNIGSKQNKINYI